MVESRVLLSLNMSIGKLTSKKRFLSENSCFHNDSNLVPE